MEKRCFKSGIFVLLVLVFIFSPRPVFAITPLQRLCPGAGVETSLGKMPGNIFCLSQWILQKSLAIAGGIGFLMMVSGVVKIVLSQGNPENIKTGQELIFSSLMGIFFILFSVFLLELIGVKILEIPGF